MYIGRRLFRLTGAINCIQGRWNTIKIEEEAENLQKAEDGKDMRPTCDYQGRLGIPTETQNVAMGKKDGAEFQRLEETMHRWGE